MRKKTKQLLTKLAIGITAIAGGGYLLFGKKKDKKETIVIKEEKDKDNLFI